MKLTLSPTKEIVRVSKMDMVRVWTGTTDKGVPVRALIAFVGAEEGYDHAEFEAALFSSPAPDEEPLTVSKLVNIIRGAGMTVDPILGADNGLARDPQSTPSTQITTPK